MRLGVAPTAPSPAPAARPAGDAVANEPELADLLAVHAMPRDAARLADGSVLLVLGLSWGLALGWFVVRRQRRGPPAAADPAAAAAAFVTAAEHGDPDLAARFEAYLATVLGSDVASAAADVLAATLAATVPDGGLVERAVRLRHSLLAARYAGLSSGARVAVQQVVLDLEAARMARQEAR